MKHFLWVLKFRLEQRERRKHLSDMLQPASNSFPEM